MPGLKASVVDKTLAVLGRRLEPAGAAVTDEARVRARRVGPDAGRSPRRRRADADLIVVFGASAIADRRDVIPAAIEAAGGTVEHFGMPVDPGNLLLVGSIGGKPVIGAPGCARSPKENGFDWVLQRLLAGVPVTRADIAGLGVGGLLMEIVSRPQPRAGGDQRGGGVTPAAIVLAAGRGTRFAAGPKLLARLDGKPLVRHVAEAAAASAARPVLVVTGHRADGGRGLPRRAPGRLRAEPLLCGRPLDLAPGRLRGPARGGAGGDRAPRRHADGRGGADRPPPRGLGRGRGARRPGADLRRHGAATRSSCRPPSSPRSRA